MGVVMVKWRGRSLDPLRATHPIQRGAPEYAPELF